MTKFLPLAAAVLVAAVAAPAAAKDKTVFTYKGVEYTYTEEKVGDSTVIKGVALPGDQFYLVVRNGQVVGTANGMPVSFRVKDAKVLKGEVKILASN